MPDYPNEPASLRLARAAVSILPKGRSAVVRRVARLTGNDRPFFASVGPGKFLIDLREIVSRTLYLYGSFEPVVTKLIAGLLRPGDTYFDIGANFGYFTVLGSRSVGPTGKVLAFEPDPRNIERLLSILKANNAANVEHIPVGLFDRDGTVSFNLVAEGEDNMGGSSIIMEATGRQRIEIQVTTLDAFAASRNIEKIDLIKMDIEGAEVQAVAGTARLLAEKRIRQFLVEVHIVAIGKEKALALAEQIAAAGYHAYHVTGHEDVSGDVARMLTPLAGSRWEEGVNPHCLFTLDPIPGVK